MRTHDILGRFHPEAEVPAYSTVHVQLWKWRGPANLNTCACGQEAKVWSCQRHTLFGTVERAGGPIPLIGYSTDLLNDYLPECKRCAAQTDIAANAQFYFEQGAAWNTQ